MTGIYANFTEETCTGTGDILTLIGATTGNIRFDLSLSVGDFISCALVDSGGTIKVAGVYEYTAVDQLTRSDTWNINASSVVDDNPSSNITLSGGTHTVRCDVINDDLKDAGTISGSMYAPDTGQELTGVVIALANEILYAPLVIPVSGSFDTFEIDITVGGTNARMGLYDTKNGLPNALVAVHDTSFSVSSTGDTQATFDGGAVNLRKGDYYVAIFVDANLSLKASQTDSKNFGFMGGTSADAPSTHVTKALTYTTMPDPANLVSRTIVGSRTVMMGVLAT